mmetsp:Transcript_95357/g.269876  ORF Transcript_95357/g.269876 Transcript_95357/m.269876 type:complete len:321 (+) Transcript_95357:40-1002(+)
MVGRAARTAVLLLAVAQATEDGIVAPATDEVLNSRTFSASVDGEGQTRVGRMSLRASVGTVTFQEEEYLAVAYVGQRDFGGYDLFDAFCVRSDGGAIALLYGYCYPSGSADSQLSAIWSEGYGATMAKERTVGRCELSANATVPIHVELPALRALPEVSDLGIDVRGAGICLGAAGGGIVTPDPAGGAGERGLNQTLVPFNLVDCTGCPGGPWLEIHSILHDAPSGACFGILYLFPDDPGTIQLEYTFCVPGPHTADAIYRDVTWRRTPGTLALNAAAVPPWAHDVPRLPPPSRLARARADLRRGALGRTGGAELVNVLV